jgi:hypothetical protein
MTLWQRRRRTATSSTRQRAVATFEGMGGPARHRAVVEPPALPALPALYRGAVVAVVAAVLAVFGGCSGREVPLGDTATPAPDVVHVVDARAVDARPRPDGPPSVDVPLPPDLAPAPDSNGTCAPWGQKLSMCYSAFKSALLNYCEGKCTWNACVQEQKKVAAPYQQAFTALTACIWSKCQKTLCDNYGTDTLFYCSAKQCPQKTDCCYGMKKN